MHSITEALTAAARDRAAEVTRDLGVEIELELVALTIAEFGKMASPVREAAILGDGDAAKDAAERAAVRYGRFLEDEARAA